MNDFMTPPHHVHFRAKELFNSASELQNGAIAYLAPGGGGPLEPHTHSHDHLFIVVRGQATILLGEETHEVAANESFLVPGGILHSVWNQTEEETVMVGLTVRSRSN